MSKATNGARTHNHKVFNLVLDQLGYETLMFIYEFCTIINLWFWWISVFFFFLEFIISCYVYV